MTITSQIAELFDRECYTLAADIYANRHSVAVLGDSLPSLTHCIPAYPVTVNHGYTSRASMGAAAWLFLARVQSHVDLAPAVAPDPVGECEFTPPAALPMLPAPKPARTRGKRPSPPSDPIPLPARAPSSDPLLPGRKVRWIPVPAMRDELPMPQGAEPKRIGACERCYGKAFRLTRRFVGSSRIREEIAMCDVCGKEYTAGTSQYQKAKLAAWNTKAGAHVQG